MSFPTPPARKGAVLIPPGQYLFLPDGSAWTVCRCVWQELDGRGRDEQSHAGRRTMARRRRDDLARCIIHNHTVDHSKNTVSLSRPLLPLPARHLTLKLLRLFQPPGKFRNLDRRMMNARQPLRLLQRLRHPRWTREFTLGCGAVLCLDGRCGEGCVWCCLVGDGGEGGGDQGVGCAREFPECGTTLGFLELVGFVGEEEGARDGCDDCYTLCAAKG